MQRQQAPTLVRLRTSKDRSDSRLGHIWRAVNFVTYIDHSQIRTLAITCDTSIGETMKLNSAVCHRGVFSILLNCVFRSSTFPIVVELHQVLVHPNLLFPCIALARSFFLSAETGPLSQVGHRLNRLKVRSLFWLKVCVSIPHKTSGDLILHTTAPLTLFQWQGDLSSWLVDPWVCILPRICHWTQTYGDGGLLWHVSSSYSV